MLVPYSKLCIYQVPSTITATQCSEFDLRGKQIFLLYITIAGNVLLDFDALPPCTSCTQSNCAPSVFVSWPHKNAMFEKGNLGFQSSLNV